MKKKEGKTIVRLNNLILTEVKIQSINNFLLLIEYKISEGVIQLRCVLFMFVNIHTMK